MLVALGTYLVLALALFATSIIMIAVGVVYRIREQLLRAATFISLALSFASAFLFQNSVTEKLLVSHGIQYIIVKQWDVSLINAFKGPIIGAEIPPASWTSYHGLIVGTATFLAITAAIAAYLSVQMFGVSEKVAAVAGLVFAIIAVAGAILTHRAYGLASTGQDLATAFRLRDQAAILKLLAILIPFLIMAAGSFQLYRETGTKVYAVYGIFILVGVIGFAILGTTWFKGWEDYVVKTLAPQGNLGPAFARFTTAAILMIIAALGVLVGSIIEATPPAEEAEEEFEELEEVEEVEEAEAEEGESA